MGSFAVWMNVSCIDFICKSLHHNYSSLSETKKLSEESSPYMVHHASFMHLILSDFELSSFPVKNVNLSVPLIHLFASFPRKFIARFLVFFSVPISHLYLLFLFHIGYFASSPPFIIGMYN